MSDEELIELAEWILREGGIFTRELKKIEVFVQNIRMKAKARAHRTRKSVDFGEQMTFSGWL